MLYYAMLNLTRAAMAAGPRSGDFGTESHGLTYDAGPSLLDCTAQVSRRGTFSEFLASLGYTADLNKRRISLREFLAQIPEMRADFPLFNHGQTAVALVVVKAFIRGETFFEFHVAGVSEEDFRGTWQTMFPALTETCELHQAPFTLRIKSRLKNQDEIERLCRETLMPDLRPRRDALWFHHVERDGVTFLPRAVAYLGAMFILSNVTRYEPELLAEPTRDLTDAGYALTTFLDSAERFFPQLILNELYGQHVFFE